MQGCEKILKIEVSQANLQAATIQRNLEVTEEGSAGRSASNDLHLPDPSRIISSLHCRFFKRGGSFYVRDESSNGTFVNEPDVFLSSGEEYRINSGDILGIGDYKLLLKVERQKLSPPVAESDNAAMIESLQKIVNEQISGKSEPQEVKSQETQDRLVFDVGMIEGELANLLQPQSQHPLSSPEKEPSEQRPSTPSFASENLPESSHLGIKATFAATAGIEEAVIAHLSEQELAALLGKMLKTYTSGLLKSLQVRAHVKAESDANRTLVVPTENNQLKFSIDSEDALVRLLGRKKKGYMEPTIAVQSAFEDLQQTLIAELEARILEKKQILLELNPKAIEKHVLSNVKGFRLNQKSLFWRQFTKRFEKLTYKK